MPFSFSEKRPAALRRAPSAPPRNGSPSPFRVGAPAHPLPRLFRGHGHAHRHRLPAGGFFRLAFQEIGIPPEQYEVTLLSARSYDEARLREEADRIEALWRSGKIDFCVTIFFNIRDLLLARHVPVYVLQPSFEDIRGGIERLVLSHELRLSRNSQLAVIAVKTDIPEDRFPADSGYELALAQLHVTKRIYQFARAIQAACIELAPAEYLLFTTRSLVENGTAQYRRLSLLDTVRRETPFTLSVGFGLGATAEEAKLHAQRAMAHAAASGGGRAFLIGSGIFSPVPMSRNDRQDQQTESRPYQEAFLSLAKRPASASACSPGSTGP